MEDMDTEGFKVPSKPTKGSTLEDMFERMEIAVVGRANEDDKSDKDIADSDNDSEEDFN